jgi:TonB family protein
MQLTLLRDLPYAFARFATIASVTLHLGACAAKTQTQYHVVRNEGRNISHAELMDIKFSSVSAAIAMQELNTAYANGSTPFDRPPNLIHVELPNYPDSARRAGVEGVVELVFSVDEFGYVHNVKVLASPDQSLTIASLDAIRKWRFAPFTIGGVAVKARLRQHFPFRFSK